MKPNRFLPVFIDIAGKPEPHNTHELDTGTLCADGRIILQQLGFGLKEPGPAEPDYTEYALCLGNRQLLRNVEVTLAGSFIDVWAEEHARGLAPGQKLIVHARPFTWRELAAVLKALA